MTFTERSNCPVCRSNDAEKVRLSADIVRCEECGLVYLRTRPPVKQLEYFYQNYHSNPGSHMALPKNAAEVKSSGLRRDYFMKEILALTGEPLGKEWRFLDIGSGWGAFLDNARDHGFMPVGVEICKGMADFSAQNLLIETHSTQLECCSLPGGLYSVVSAIHTLEHLPYLYRSLSQIHDILKPGGFFCGIVPNFDSYCSQKMGDQWVWLDANWHYQHFTPETLASTLRRFNFEPVSIYTKQGDFDGTIIQSQIRIREPHVHAIAERMKELEESGQGEEIRFFAMRN